MKAINKEKYRHYVRYLLCLLGMQVVVYVIRTFFLSTMINQSLYDAQYNDNNVARIVTILLSVICVVWFCIMVAIVKVRNIEGKRLYRQEVKDTTVTLKALIKRCLPLCVGHTVIFAAVQIPWLAFYMLFGYDYSFATSFELFYSLQLGFYEITRIGILGFIMSCAFFFAVSMLLDILVYRSWNSNRA